MEPTIDRTLILSQAANSQKTSLFIHHHIYLLSSEQLTMHSQSGATYKMRPMIKSVLQIKEECIIVNIILYKVYFVIIFHMYSLLMAIQAGITNVVYSNTFTPVDDAC